MKPKTNSDTTPKLYVGLDVHKEQTSVATADPGADGEVRSHGSIVTCLPSIEKLLRRLAKAKGIALSDIHVCYEAGGCGMWIARALKKIKVQCTVVAPSLIPTKAGDHVKTDKKDAIKLVRLLRAAELTAVHVPDEADEAIRDLCRARVDAVDDLRRAKNRLTGLLRRLGHRYAGAATWSEAHMRYLRDLKMPYPSHSFILEEIIQQTGELQERIARIEDQMELQCADWSRKPLVDAIMALRGFKIIAAMMVVSEIGDFVRFTHPKQLMSYLGLTPGEYSSGGKQKQGSITKCGNSHLRWLMVECATHYRLDPKVSVNLSKRQEGQPRWIKDISWKAQNRLNARYKTLQNRLMHYNKIKVSIARELTGVIWEIGFKMQSASTPDAK
jgi:transposase